ncbi:MAG: excinuclease ABC subunit C [endosymbiont of Galathealinum brachiosum]|uniref:UvrABC system protein C n=1 Tax=endosymbiont of Galathealinum brachiosum TaxID=2200906 RepID=A0A370DN75_9GAMM|nr:MAG: excinuclease ABC subunit C [endosymbiont of Galathealinum brachiosum]
MSELSTETPFDAEHFLKNVSSRAGVYRMYDCEQNLLYVGKAKNLKKRLSSYFRKTGLSIKTTALVKKIQQVEVTITHTESEALLLESNLIKENQPPYNILLRDDKSYPYIYVSSQEAYPQIVVHRGAKRKKGKYLGPFPSAGAVRDSLQFIHKLFKIRTCEDSYFKNRSRPCLQYQIKRCTAPCMGYISEARYQADINHALMFLEGKSNQLIEDLVKQMETAATGLDFEKAAINRDQIRMLQKVVEKQYISGDDRDVDIVACYCNGSQACVQVFFIREGRNLGNRSYFPKLPEALPEAEVLSNFISQYYLQQQGAQQQTSEIILSHEVDDMGVMEQAITERVGHKIRLSHQVRSDRARWVTMALNNAETALKARMNSRTGMLKRFEELQKILQLDELPTRLECFDISHTFGEATVASCVVFTLEGAYKQDYRRFNIEGIEPGDDYAAMRQALQRRYTSLKKARDKENGAKMPDILFIDGGKGQLRQAVEVMDQLQIDDVLLIGVAKGEGRKAGLEKLVFSDGRQELYLPEDSIAFHLILNVRDEAHRFAISGHRAKRDKARRTSVLEAIPGLGPKRRQNLIKHFGGMQGVKPAGVEDLAKVPGISRNLAQIIYDVLRSE